jgi:tetratricopeptide (TPR) repeat protein
MRLEIEPTVATPQVSDEIQVQDHAGEASAEVKSMLNQGIKAAQAGNRSVARIALQRTTELDPRNESAWLWLASISEYPEELLGFLNHVLEINPANQRAIEWKAATNTLLAKTFVQRGIDACEENQKDFGAQCFQTALQYDERNATAHMWMASLAEGSAVKVGFLEKALEIEPGNESALAALDAAKKGIIKERLTEAKSAVVAGNNPEAVNILEALLAVTPDSVEAWTMKSHLAEGFDEKIRCFESILAIDPENVAARSGRDSLLSIFGTMEAAEAESGKEVEGTPENSVGESFEMSIDRVRRKIPRCPMDLLRAASTPDTTNNPILKDWKSGVEGKSGK